jgi:hypothetical protein
MVQVKIHSSYREVVAICDSNLVGKKFEENNLQLDVKESFYKGEEISKEKLSEVIKKMLLEDATFNIVGEESINVALEHGIISQKGIKKIQNIPFALILL